MGLNVTYYRRLRGLTQEALGAEMDVDATQISRIENARVGVSLDTLFKIANILDAPPDKLLELRT